MQKKRWQFALILTVAILTIYNILPTLFFYTKPLKSPIDEPRAQEVSSAITKRINALEPQAIAWLGSFCKLLKLHPISIEQDAHNDQILSVTFNKEQDAQILRRYLPRAGSLIPFVPAQLSLYGNPSNDSGKTVLIQRNTPVTLDPTLQSAFFAFSPKWDGQGQISELYKTLLSDRFKQIVLAAAGASQTTQLSRALLDTNDPALSHELVLTLSDTLVSFVQAFGDSSPLANRFFSCFAQMSKVEKDKLLTKWKATAEDFSQELEAMQQEEISLKNTGSHLPTEKLQLKEVLSSRVAHIKMATSLFAKHVLPLHETIEAWTQETVDGPISESLATQVLSLQGRNPFINSIQIDFQKEEIHLHLYADVLEKKEALLAQGEKAWNRAEQFLFNEFAYLSRQTDETISPGHDDFHIALSQMPDSKSFLAFKLSTIARTAEKNVTNLLHSAWNPSHPDLQPEAFPVLSYDAYLSLPADQTRTSLIIYAPCLEKNALEPGFRMNSIYVIAKGFDKIAKKLEGLQGSTESKQFSQDFQNLQTLLNRLGYMGYPGSALTTTKKFGNDYIFEAPDYYRNVLAASRENFSVKGSKRYAVLEFSTVEQRILTENKIDNAVHEDLLKWKDDYTAAQLNIKGVSLFDVPKPTESVFFSNIKLSALKYFRGDDRKVLHWGLDLSGGKTVQIEMRDANNRLVTNEADIKQGISELYARVNKMGVSEVSIRQEGDFITLDFPGSQSLSAKELVKASSMHFHVVNEKFSPNNTSLANATQKFLQEIWNEAVITNRKSMEEINRIACNHLYGDSLDVDSIQPRSEAAALLYQQGLRIALPTDTNTSSTFDDTYSKIVVLRGQDYTQWQGQTHPLLVVFRNFALEGSNLEDVRASYDPSRGNFLAFGVKSSYTNKEGLKCNPQADFQSWTTPFSKEKIAGTLNGQFSHNNGWRMAVVLNGSVVSSPTLDSPLKDSAMITGSFSQREINQLEADLKAGSLSFSPKILSEKNVSPELGSKERTLGIWATVIALILVTAVMTGYYQFGGLVASLAVIFNILIMWATLQNIHATLTLASLAGLILTVGMAVDANVLVFERIREEFSVTGRISSAIQTGYKKAFSAIIDSNITTILAALILLQFDSGPIRGFAVTLIIGILSSMFTALFVTRFFFQKWAENPNNKVLNMRNWFKTQNFNFLKWAKTAFVSSLIVIGVGTIAFTVESHSIFGMDFTGGYSLNLEVEPNSQSSYRQSIEKALVQAGAKPQEIQVRELSPSNCVKIFLSRNLELPGRPLANLHTTGDSSAQIQWVVSALQKADVHLSSNASLEQNWSVVSGQMSRTMRNHAIVGLLIALLSIFVYIAFRFEFKYAISATLCLVHDLLFTLGSIALLHLLGVPVQIDLTIIAALMTIAGYSLNDTIIVFDRIREESKKSKKSQLPTTINHALNVTLSRTVLTSGTTLVVLLPLIAMGGSTIFGFSLVMGIGVIFGTLSSLFIAAPLMLFFHKRELEKQQRIALNS